MQLSSKVSLDQTLTLMRYVSHIHRSSIHPHTGVQIFELEDELMEESALDMEETDEVPPNGIIQRRLSQASRRHPSGASQHQPGYRHASSSTTGHSTPPAPSSPQKTEFPAPGPSTSPQSQSSRPQQGPGHIQLPRVRLNSVVTRGLDIAQAAASPLAQIFQPLIVDDDIIPEEQQQSDGGAVTSTSGSGTGAAPGPVPTPGALVSYGPATRRRMLSMHVAPNPPRRLRTYSAAGHAPNTHAPAGGAESSGYGATGESSTALRRFPTNSPPMRSHLGLVSQVPLSESPDDKDASIREVPREEEEAQATVSSPIGLGPRETASQVENEDTLEGSDLERRLQSMEERQKRIENMLVEISRNMRR